MNVFGDDEQWCACGDDNYAASLNMLALDAKQEDVFKSIHAFLDCAFNVISSETAVCYARYANELSPLQIANLNLRLCDIIKKVPPSLYKICNERRSVKWIAYLSAITVEPNKTLTMLQPYL